MTEKTLTPAEVAERYAVNIATVYGWIKEGHLKAVRLGRRTYRITAEALKAFEDERIF